jgi:hypothetical protein
MSKSIDLAAWRWPSAYWPLAPGLSLQVRRPLPEFRLALRRWLTLRSAGASRRRRG